jgi:drug/metabolite transporter (DMT)-like permease
MKLHAFLVGPPVFVFLWSTGFIGAKYGLPYAGPFTLLAGRFAVAAVVLAVWALAMGSHWPRRARTVFDCALVGVLAMGCYVGGVFVGISHGVPAGVAALIVGLQPLLTAALAGPVLSERVTAREWAGLILGLVGVIMVVAERVTLGAGDALGIGSVFGALIGITAGSLYQKRFGTGASLAAGTSIQLAVCAAVFAPLAIALEDFAIHWTPTLIATWAYLTLVLSVGMMPLYYLLIRKSAAAKVASLMYLVPPLTAAIAYVAFDEQLGVLALAGMAVAALGVALVNRPKRAPQTAS